MPQCDTFHIEADDVAVDETILRQYAIVEHAERFHSVGKNQFCVVGVFDGVHQDAVALRRQFR